MMPLPRVSPTGLTEMNEIVGAVIVTVVDFVTLPRAAEIVVDPAATAVSIPFTSMVAAAVEDDCQVTNDVRSRLLPSL